MRLKLGLLIVLLTITLPAFTKTMMIISTNLGDITLELDEKKAPITVKNFQAYADAGFYDGTIFHRVIRGFMIQGGGFDESMEQKKTNKPIKNEADNGLTNDEMTIAMARTQVVDSATSQFFINLANNSFLNNGSRDFGYAVFGKVVSGQDVVKKIGQVGTGSRNGHQDVPTENVTIISVKRAK